MSVVVPFYGTADEARELIAALASLRRAPGDEVIVADNTEDGRFPGAEAPDWMRVVRAPLERSSYYARNVGVEASRQQWLLFLDSDCRPEPDVLDAYFAPPPDERCGILSGSVVADPDQRELTARYARSRQHIDPEHYRERPGRPAGITANLLVRRAAWDDVHGFHEGIKSGGDLEFCWRVQDSGWTFDWRPEARVAHLHVDTVGKLLRKTVRHAGGGGWVNNHHAGAFPRPPLVRGLTRSVVGALVWLATGRVERALFKAIDGVFLTADAYGRLAGNRAARDPLPAAADRIAVVALAFPNPGEDPARTTASAIAGDGASVRIEAWTRPTRPDRQARRELRTTFGEDDGVLARGRALLWLLATRPVAVLRATRYPGARLSELAPAARRVVVNGEAVAPASGADLPRARKLAALAGGPLRYDDV